MKRYASIVAAAAIALSLAISGVVNAQEYREYLARGIVTDTENQPIVDVEIRAKNRSSYRVYSTSTDDDGRYKVFGISHGVYDVEFSKEGYQSFETEWSFEAPQTEMKRVDITPVILLSTDQKQRLDTHKRVQEHFDSATEKLNQGDIDGALSDALAILEHTPDDANAQYIAGACLLEKEQYDEAVKHLLLAAELQPDFALAQLRLAIAYQHQQDIDSAVSWYDRTLELEPDNIAALYNAGAMLYDAGRSEESLSYLERALKLKPDDFNILEMMGYCELQKGQYAKAYEHLSKARQLTEDPEIGAGLDAVLEGLRVTVESASNEPN